MRPEDFVVNPVLEPWWKGRLEYLLLYEPQRTWEKFLENRKQLYREMRLAVQKACLYKRKLKENPNLEPDQIQEIVMDSVSPTDGEPKEPLEDNQEMRLRAWARDPPESKADELKVEKMMREYRKQTRTTA